MQAFVRLEQEGFSFPNLLHESHPCEQRGLFACAKLGKELSAHRSLPKSPVLQSTKTMLQAVARRAAQAGASRHPMRALSTPASGLPLPLASGTPTKRKPRKPTNASADSASASVSTIQAAGTPAKRKPGRPRKAPADPASAVVSTIQAAPEPDLAADSVPVAASPPAAFPAAEVVSPAAAAISFPHRQHAVAAQSPPPPSLAAVRSAPGVFVSEHFRLTPGEVEEYLQRHGVEFRQSGAHAIVKACPFCHDAKGKADNMHKLYVELSSGVYFCHRCAAKGSWFALRNQVGGEGLRKSPLVHGISEASGFGVKRKRLHDSLLPKESPEWASEALKQNLPAPHPHRFKKMQENLLGKTFSPARLYMNEGRGLTTETFTKYGVGADQFCFVKGNAGVWDSYDSFVFPMYDGDRRLVRLKIRAVEHKAHMRLSPKGGAWGMFGLDTVPADAEEIILTEGEFDAMAVFQATGRPAVSLPNGARSLPVSLLPALERFKKIYLWMDDDIPGQEGAQHFARKLGMQRCFIVRSGSGSTACKDANDALLKGLNLSRMLKSASTVPHEGIATFSDLREEILMELSNPLQVQGIQSRLLPRLSKLMRGHRSGELTIFSGHTGVGKTTLLSQLSLDYCMQGVPTLWGSFEINNVRLAKLLLTQFYAISTGNAPGIGLVSDFDEWADKFDELPLLFMRYFGSNPIDRVIDAMEYASYVHDCSHVLLDNLQFMTSGQGRGASRIEVMEGAIEKIRRFSTINNAHVSLVVHPRKEDDDQALQTASIWGSGKAVQEADNLIILQKTIGGPMLDVRKNRFDGTLGSVNLHFNTKSRLFEERDAPMRMEIAPREESLQHSPLLRRVDGIVEPREDSFGL